MPEPTMLPRPPLITDIFRVRRRRRRRRRRRGRRRRRRKGIV
jgi:hypothetical protein